MIPKEKIILIVALSVSILSFSQNYGKAYYIKKSAYSFDTPERANYNSETKASLNSVNNDISSFEYVLTFSDAFATYEEVKKLQVKDNSTTTNLAKVFSGYKGPYYFDFKNKKVVRKKGKYLIEKSFRDYNWELTKEKLVINNLTCYKATTEIELEGRRGIIKRKVIAWYTPDINVFAGPDGFTGLPGLIIQLEVNRVVTTLKKIEFSDKKINIKQPTKGQKITENEFKVFTKDLYMNRKKDYNKQ